MANHPLSLKHVNKETGSSPMGVSFAPQKDIQLQFGFNSVYNHFRFTSMWELWNGKVKKRERQEFLAFICLIIQPNINRFFEDIFHLPW